jgi:CheY-like chemotaxis protein
MKGNALQVLLIEDNAGDARLLREMFRTEDPDSFELTHLLRMSEAVSHLAKRAFVHLAVIPIIVVSARDREMNKERALKAGANVFLQKPARLAGSRSAVAFRKG